MKRQREASLLPAARRVQGKVSTEAPGIHFLIHSLFLFFAFIHGHTHLFALLFIPLLTCVSTVILH